MKIPLLKTDAYRPAPLFAALVLVALVPALGVLWFMTVAMRNERLAVQERLTAVYANHLALFQQRAAAFARERQAALRNHLSGTPAETFAAIVRANLADGVIITGADGKVLYPASTVAAAELSGAETSDWARARELEFQKSDWIGAADLYGHIAASSPEPNARARAMQAQAVCWLKGGARERALAQLAALAGDASLRHAVSEQGALIVAHAQLLMLKIVSPALHGRDGRDDVAASISPAKTLDDLVARLNDYADAGLPANQRRFLMTEVQAIAKTPNLFPTLAAENLAASYLKDEPPTDALATAATLHRTLHATVWRLPGAGQTVVALLREERVRAELVKELEALALPDVRVSALAPGAITAINGPVPPQDAGEFFPGWRLALGFRDGDPFAEASTRQARFYLWMGVSVVAIIAVLAVMVARYVSAQMRLARMKDDLVSTVSHELKTPVASMRVLLDTLAAGRHRDEAHLQRYLQLATKENSRLSQLIENFLVFSRLERGQQQFRFTALSPSEIVRTALDALGEKLTTPPCHLTVELAADLPAIHGDADALSTVLVNLLDNAHKYTNGEKHIDVKAYVEGAQMIVAVTDNGIGIAPEDQRRIFDRFYQVDQSLTRRRGGCGLGLSIVRSIVRAHDGELEVVSAPGRGSTFRIKLPLFAPATAAATVAASGDSND